MDRKRVSKSSSFSIDLSVPSSASSSSSSPNFDVIDDDDSHLKLPKKKKQDVSGAFNILLNEVVVADENDDMPQDAILVEGSSKVVMVKEKIEGNHSIIKPEASFGIAEDLLSLDDLSYLNLNDNAGYLASSPKSANSNYSDQFYEHMEVEEDDEVAYIPHDDSLSPWKEDIFEHDPHPSSSAIPSDSIPIMVQIKINSQKFKEFKQFDTVVGHSDHHFVEVQNPGNFYFHAATSSCKPLPPSGQLASKELIKQIQHEWSILEKDLPDSIYVRVYEERMDFLRAVIVGAAGTPYHDGLFFFDIFLPPDYPNSPPLVHYRSFGHRINPNLYKCGKVCLSLLNTWHGSRAKSETWIPGKSTILQVLVSIQALVLNAKPYFNEPGYENLEGKEEGEKESRSYSENIFILSMKSVMHLLRHPPKHFESFVCGHFLESAPRILEACQTYMAGAQVGCLAAGRVQDVDEDEQSCSKTFKDSLSQLFPQLMRAFTDNGTDCQKFLPKPKEPLERKLIPKIWN